MIVPGMNILTHFPVAVKKPRLLHELLLILKAESFNDVSSQIALIILEH